MSLGARASLAELLDKARRSSKTRSRADGPDGESALSACLQTRVRNGAVPVDGLNQARRRGQGPESPTGRPAADAAAP